MQEFFDLKLTPYSLRNNPLRLPKTNASRYGTEALCFKVSIIWNPNRYENLNFLDKFKQQIKMWKPTTCTCKLCKDVYFEIYANITFFAYVGIY